MLKIVIAAAVQSIFRLKICRKNIFFIFKKIFLRSAHQNDLKTQKIFNNKKKIKKHKCVPKQFSEFSNLITLWYRLITDVSTCLLWNIVNENGEIHEHKMTTSLKTLEFSFYMLKASSTWKGPLVNWTDDICHGISTASTGSFTFMHVCSPSSGDLYRDLLLSFFSWIFWSSWSIDHPRSDQSPSTRYCHSDSDY